VVWSSSKVDPSLRVGIWPACRDPPSPEGEAWSLFDIVNRFFLIWRSAGSLVSAWGLLART